MQHFLKFALLVVCCVALAQAAQPRTQSNDQELLEFLMSTRSMQMENPQRSVTCFDYYIPLLNELAEAYKIEYGYCVRNADERRAGIDSSTGPHRQEIDAASSNACWKLNQCGGYQDSINYFECYANTGSENREVMYTISVNATEILSIVREQYHIIEYDETRCLTTAQRKYDEEREETYNEMQTCLSGETSVPNGPKPTNAPTTTTKRK